MLSTGKAVEVPRFSNLLEPDKLGHAAAYFVLAGLLWWGFYRARRLAFATMAIAVLLSSAYGIGIEFVQYTFFPNRFFEVLDIIANIIGSIFGVLALYFLVK